MFFSPNDVTMPRYKICYAFNHVRPLQHVRRWTLHEYVNYKIHTLKTGVRGFSGANGNERKSPRGLSSRAPQPRMVVMR